MIHNIIHRNFANVKIRHFLSLAKTKTKSSQYERVLYECIRSGKARYYTSSLQAVLELFVLPVIILG